MKLVFEPPSSEAPGYLRRMRRALELQNALKEEGMVHVDVLDGIVELLLPFVKEPEDRDVAREALWDASKSDFDRMLKAVSGSEDEKEDPTPPEE